MPRGNLRHFFVLVWHNLGLHAVRKSAMKPKWQNHLSYSINGDTAKIEECFSALLYFYETSIRLSLAICFECSDGRPDRGMCRRCKRSAMAN